MQGLDAAHATIGNFRFPEFCLLRQLRALVMRDEGHPVIDVELCLESESRQPPAMIRIVFHGVSSLQVRDLGGEARIAGFDVADYSDRQLEGIRWRVFDFEDDAIDFYAEDAEIVAASVIESTQDTDAGGELRGKGHRREEM